MILRIFAVYDIPLGAYGNPMFLVSPGQAVRSFTDEVNRSDKENLMYMHPEDFELFQLGSYDTETGLFETVSPERVCSGRTVAIRPGVQA